MHGGTGARLQRESTRPSASSRIVLLAPFTGLCSHLDDPNLRLQKAQGCLSTSHPATTCVPTPRAAQLEFSELSTIRELGIARKVMPSGENAKLNFKTARSGPGSRARLHDMPSMSIGAQRPSHPGGEEDERERQPRADEALKHGEAALNERRIRAIGFPKFDDDSFRVDHRLHIWPTCGFPRTSSSIRGSAATLC